MSHPDRDTTTAALHEAPDENAATPAPSAGRRGYRRISLALALIATGLVVFGAVAAEDKRKPKPAPAAETTAPAPAPTAAPSPEKLNDAKPAWTVACISAARATPPNCRIEQRLFAKETGRALSVAMVEIPGATRQATLLMQLPNGIALQDGVSLAIDGGAATPLALQSCDANGCYATLALTAALVEAMEKGKVMTVKAVAANRQPLVFEHLLTDFGAAYEAAK
jgi:invasion protein IalB